MQTLREIYTILTKDPVVTDFVKLVQEVVNQTKDVIPEDVPSSEVYQKMYRELQKLSLNKLEQSFSKLPKLPKITAIILKASKDYTIAFLMIPENYSYGWHDHRNMNGLSKCLCGQITIEAINPKYLETHKEENEYFSYPVDEIRKENLIFSENNVSCIYPNSYNIHKIVTGKQQAAFLDILLPEYPDHGCTHYEQLESKSDQKIRLKPTPDKLEQIIGLETLIKYLKKPTTPI